MLDSFFATAEDAGPPSIVGPVMNIVVWLRNLGLGKYEAVFRENDIDETVLPKLTAEDLKELGVASCGTVANYWMPSLLCVAKRGAKTPSIAAAIAPPSAAIAAVPVAEAVGERRYLTVMFCDLVGSTAISAQLDPEEWRDLVGAYLDRASAAVAEMGGHVAKKLGDGLCACSAIRRRMRTTPSAPRAPRLRSSARLLNSTVKTPGPASRNSSPASASTLVQRWWMRRLRFMGMSPTSRRGCRR